MPNYVKYDAVQLARKTSDAYSVFGFRSWIALSERLLRKGFSMDEAETILRSKLTRWACDGSDARYGRVPAKAIDRLLTADSLARLGLRQPNH